MATEAIVPRGHYARTPEHRGKMAAIFRGRALSPEWRAQISRSLTGRSHTVSPEARERMMLASTRHGLYGTRIYRAWTNMLQRCNNPKNPRYRLYGARGISVCARWYSVANFHADMGDPPKGLSIDRINNDGNYEPANCRWATAREQSLNTCRSIANRPARATGGAA